MSRDFLDTLKGLTPSGGDLDRDALLFEAGRASAPPAGRAWMLVGLLALTQALTLALWLVPAAPPAPPPAVAPPLSLPAEGGPAALRQLSEEPPVPTADLLPDAPPLRPIDRTVFTSLE